MQSKHNFDLKKKICMPNFSFNSTEMEFIYYFQARSNIWSKTEISYTTERANRLPIIDVAVRDVGAAGQEFAIEIGAVCFQTVEFEN